MGWKVLGKEEAENLKTLKKTICWASGSQSQIIGSF